MPTELTIALERYDRHVPFFMGMVSPPAGIDLKVLEVGMAPPRRDGVNRHRRFMSGGEFDICEMSLSSYLTAKSRGLDYTATPVFPRRLFSQNHMFVSAAAGIEKPDGSDRPEGLLPQFPDHHVGAGQRRPRVRVRRALAGAGLADHEHRAWWTGRAARPPT